MPRLSADKKTLAFDTVDTSPSIIRGLKAGRYELKETVTPEAYKTADAIVFTLRNDGSAECPGEVVVAGSPIVMVDLADPTYKVPNKPNLPSTGEEVSPATVIGIITILAAVCLAGTGVYRIKKKKN
jgi:LPXTG-motif cell wall-anchored protein